MSLASSSPLPMMTIRSGTSSHSGTFFVCYFDVLCLCCFNCVYILVSIGRVIFASACLFLVAEDYHHSAGYWQFQTQVRLVDYRYELDKGVAC